MPVSFAIQRIQALHCVPSMGNNLVVKVHYGLGSRNR